MPRKTPPQGTPSPSLSPHRPLTAPSPPPHCPRPPARTVFPSLAVTAASLRCSPLSMRSGSTMARDVRRASSAPYTMASRWLVKPLHTWVAGRTGEDRPYATRHGILWPACRSSLPLHACGANAKPPCPVPSCSALPLPYILYKEAALCDPPPCIALDRHNSARSPDWTDQRCTRCALHESTAGKLLR